MKIKVGISLFIALIFISIYAAIHHVPANKPSVSELIDNPSETDQRWIKEHLPSQETIRSSGDTHGATVIELYRNSFDVTANSHQDWLFVSKAQLTMKIVNPTVGSSLILTTRTCHVNVDKASWLKSYISPDDFATATAESPARAIYLLNLRDDDEWVKCSVSQESVDQHQDWTAPILELPFETMDAAEAARLSLISHGNPVLGQSLAREDDWLNSHTPRDKVNFEVEIERGLHSIKMAHTDSFVIYAADPDTWNIVRNGDADRWVDDVATNAHAAFSFNDHCLVKYKQVDWSRAIVKQYEPSLSNNLGTHALSEAAYSLSISDPKAIECVETWPARNPSMQPKSSFLFLLFKSAAEANDFLAAVQLHAKS